jgi:hypothetical protein
MVDVNLAQSTKTAVALPGAKAKEIWINPASQYLRQDPLRMVRRAKIAPAARYQQSRRETG